MKRGRRCFEEELAYFETSLRQLFCEAAVSKRVPPDLWSMTYDLCFRLCSERERQNELCFKIKDVIDTESVKLTNMPFFMRSYINFMSNEKRKEIRNLILSTSRRLPKGVKLPPEIYLYIYVLGTERFDLKKGKSVIFNVTSYIGKFWSPVWGEKRIDAIIDSIGEES